VSTESTLPGVLTVPQSRRPVPVDTVCIGHSFARVGVVFTRRWGLAANVASPPIRLGLRSMGARPTCIRVYIYVYIYIYISIHISAPKYRSRCARISCVRLARAWHRRCAAAAQEGSSSLLRLRASPDDEPFALAHLRAHPTLRQLPLQYPSSTRGVRL
jgi:hypothetical protein